MRNIVCRIFGHTKPSLGVLLCWQCDRCLEILPSPEPNPSHYTSGFILGFTPQGAGKQDWIQCLDCKRKSYHPKDIEYKYCGFCHKFHPESL